MEQPRPTRGTDDARDGLLIIVDSTGIPVLTRPYGDVQIPPSAVVGITSALFHAAKVDNTSELRTLRSAHRTIVYVQGEAEILMAFVHVHAQDEASTASHNADRMLRLLFRVLKVTIGYMGDLEASKLRVAISRNLSLIDHVVAHSTSDARLLLELPLFEAGCRREVFPTAQSPSLVYAAWIQGGVVRNEMCPPTGIKSEDMDLVIMSIIAELHMKSKHPNVAVCVGKSHKVVGVRVDSWHQDEFVMGIFDAQATSSGIENFVNVVKDKAFLHRGQVPSVRSDLHKWFARGLELCFVAPSLPDSMHRVIVLRDLEQDSSPDIELEHSAWTMVSQFAQSFALSSSRKHRLRKDFKREDEAFTLIHCVRPPFHIYALWFGSVSMTSVVEMGDAIASAFLMMRV